MSEPDHEAPPPRKTGLWRVIGGGVITGAADDDPSAIGTYASAGAAWGPAFLWTAPATFPMMVAVVYLSAKLGQVSGRGLFEVIRRRYPRWVLYPALFGVLCGNTIEAAADIGGMAAAITVLVPVPRPVMLLGTGTALVLLQVFASYSTIRRVFQWLALSLLAYVGAALLARPDFREVWRGTLLPRVEFSREYLSMLVAVIGTSLSAYLYTWQTNQEVEDEIVQGRRTVSEREGATRRELKRSWWDIVAGMFFSNVVMYFIILATAATLFRSGVREIDTAAQAAQALQPLAGGAAGALFAAGVVTVGFLAVPVMTTGAAYDLCQTVGWKHGLHAKPREARAFYATIAAFTAVAVALNFLGFNPMRALVWSGIVQGFSTPPLLLMILLLTNDRRVMGDKVNSLPLNLLGGVTTLAVFAATVALVITWVT